MATRRALWTLIGVSTLLRLVWASSVGAYTNEAYYYMYAHHLSWGYFDHPPMVGLVAALGLKLVGGVAPVLGLRLGFIVLFAGSSWLLARLSTRWFGPRAGFLAALALNATVFYGLMIGTLAEPDGPLLFFWLLTLDRLAVVLEPSGGGRTSAWLGVGLAWGAAMLSKYHAILIPAGVVLYLVLRPSNLRCLRTPGPYLATLAGLALFSPVILWNASHGWASFAYQGNRAGGFRGIQPEMLLEALVAQFLYLTPWIWTALVVILFRLLRRGPRGWSAPEAFLACQAIPALGLFMGVATFRRIMPHWPLIGFVAVLPLLGRALAEQLAAHPVRLGRILAASALAPVVLATLFLVQARTGLFQDSRGRLLGLFSPQSDPTVDTIRWEQIARELKRRGLLDDPKTFLFTDCWRFSAELAMATRRESAVTCFHRDARSYAFWSRPADWVGRDGIYVTTVDSLVRPGHYVPWFTRVEPLATFPIVRGGVAIQQVRLFRFVQQTDPFPSGYPGRGPMPVPNHGRKAEQPAIGHLPDSRTLR